jgi:hypothetical protein
MKVIKIRKMIKLKIQIQKLVHKFYQVKDKVVYSYSFTLPLILSKLDIQISDTDTTLIKFSYGVFLLSLIGLLCFINIIGYMIVYVIIHRGDLEVKIQAKYPRLSKYITYYKNSNLIFAGLEVLFCLICLLMLVSGSLLMLYNKIFV